MTELRDKSGHGNHGTLVNIATLQDSTLDFNGRNSFVDVGSIACLRGEDWALSPAEIKQRYHDSMQE